MKHCHVISDNGGPCPNAYLAVCPELNKPGKCREVKVDEAIESIVSTGKTKKKTDAGSSPT